ncbi:MAG: hypothetical protein QOD60_1398 [Solirubrobacterales bacterium]|jgi:hypothetical protein|nr:hypothetical protein [Solirubrobacterales bacterium]
MDGWLPILFLAVILKIPVFAGMYLVWYAVKAEPDTEDAPGEETDHGFRRWRREPVNPRKPRRGPHGSAVAIAEPGRRRVTHDRRALHRDRPTPRSR